MANAASEDHRRGATWSQVLSIDADTGATDLEIDPRDPNTLYAATYDRRRHTWSLLAGGPGSGIHKSTDGGETWRTLSRGLPEGDMGKIGLAVSPASPDVVYATIEAKAEERGFYRSQDRGESWERRNEYISNGTGPHYYQEIVASPTDEDLVYQMDVFLHVTRDGGSTMAILGNGREKHSDNHALWIDPDDGKHLIAGTDGGLYETFDQGTTWRHFGNLPISQFYKLALDNSEPFYNVLGGAQDLGTLLGPSRTTNIEGVSNREWYVPMGADGYDCEFDPHDPDLIYLQWQVGRLHRYDRGSRESIDIQPLPAPGEGPERWNWDSPIAVSSHEPGRLYFGSHRLWRSDDRGDSWTAISGDLTRGTPATRCRSRVGCRASMPSTTTAPCRGTPRSPRFRSLRWFPACSTPVVTMASCSQRGRREYLAPGGGLPGADERAFVLDVEAALDDPDRVFVSLDGHKLGDFSPLLFESRDRGRSWRSIAGDLPDGHLVWAIQQDHETPDLLFAGTEFGLFFSPDRGGQWIELSAGVPTISFRDIALQRRDSDLVGATFGRGFYVLDDYSPLRAMAGGLPADAELYPVRDAWSYVPSVPMQARGKPSQGSADYTADNPPFGAQITYYLATVPQTARDERRSDEEKLIEAGEDVPFPGWERLAAEGLESAPTVLITIRDAAGHAIRRLESPAEEGLQRSAWDLRLPPPDPVSLEEPGFRPPWANDPQGPLAPPGVYTAELALRAGGEVRSLSEPQEFQIKPVPATSSDQPDYGAIASFQKRTHEALRRAQGGAEELQRAGVRLAHLRAALIETPSAEPELFGRLDSFAVDLAALAVRLVGDPIRNQLEEPAEPSVLGRLWQVAGGHWQTRQSATGTQQTSLAIAESALEEALGELKVLLEESLGSIEAESKRLVLHGRPGARFLDLKASGPWLSARSPRGLRS